MSDLLYYGLEVLSGRSPMCTPNGAVPKAVARERPRISPAHIKMSLLVTFLSAELVAVQPIDTTLRGGSARKYGPYAIGQSETPHEAGWPQRASSAMRTSHRNRRCEWRWW
jgi:hypothetical protein